MADQFVQKLRFASEIMKPTPPCKTSDMGRSRFYESQDDGFETVGDTSKKSESENEASQVLNSMLLRHRQLAQALLSVEGMDDDDSMSISSRNSGDVAILSHEDSAVFVKSSPNTSAVKNANSGDAGPTSQSRSNSASAISDFVDLAHDSSSIVDLEEYCCEAIQDEASSWYQRLFVIVMAWFVDLIDAFSETNDDIAVKEEPRTTLNVKELRQNIRRCRSQARPYLETLGGFWDLITWRSPLFTLLLFWVYMYCVWKGCVVSVFLFLVLLQLVINYLSYCRKVRLGLTLLPRKEIKQEVIESPGAQLVLEVARQAQMVLEYAADALEKIKNLFKWKRPRTTAMFGLLVLFWFIVSLVTTTSVFLTIVGFGVGIKIFITTYLYYRFPRLRHKLDVFTWFLDRTPADSGTRRESPGNVSRTSPEDPNSSFGTSFTSSGSHSPRLTRTCALIDKEKSFPFSVGSGKLFLTAHHIIFKYSRWTSGERHVVKIHFDDILAIKKTKAIKMANFGDGMAIEIYVSGREKPYLFAGIVRRDECYEMLMTLGRTAGVNWGR